MKIVHLVCTDAFAGVERYLSYLAPVLSGRGHEVVVIGGNRSQMRRNLGTEPIGWRPAGSLVAGVRALRREGDADIVHVHMTEAEIAAIVALRPGGPKLVSTRHFAAHRGRKPAARVIAPFIARRLDLQLAISRYVAAHIESSALVALTGVPPAPLGAHREHTVLVAQRLEAEKRTAVAIDAFARSELTAEGWRLVVAGEGVERTELEHHASLAGIGHAVQFVGHVADVGTLMDSAAILIAPPDQEPLGLSVVEAMARGLPVVAARGGGHLETVGPVTPHNLFEPGDAAGAAQLLRELAHDPDRRRHEGEQLRAFQQRELSIERHADRVLAAYESIL